MKWDFKSLILPGGLRITVEQILKALAGGIATQEILEDYPEVEPEDIQA